jgi:indolepyruvate ferredoxin oxidoreductase, alpha subunit
VLCPSFYQVRVITNPGWWQRLIARMRRRIISFIATA